MTLRTGDFKKELHKRTAFSAVSFLLLTTAIFLALNLGTYRFSLFELIIATIKHDPVLWNIRIPRILGAVLVGASLAVAGAVLQCILKNPLASPFTLGITHGAAFGASIAIIFFSGGTLTKVGEGVIISNPYIVPVFAFLGAMLTALAILVLARRKNLSPVAIVLAGVALSSFFQAGVMLIQYFATDIQVAAIVFWTFGDVARAGWIEIILIIGVFLLTFMAFIFRRWDYNALLLGDEVAKSLGVNPQKIRLEGLVLTSLLIAVCVSFTGIIGFVGLVAPHMVRILLGEDYRYLIPLSSILGALILLISDTVGRTLISPVILPVGIITSLIGAPMFLYLLAREGKIM